MEKLIQSKNGYICAKWKFWPFLLNKSFSPSPAPASVRSETIISKEGTNDFLILLWVSPSYLRAVTLRLPKFQESLLYLTGILVTQHWCSLAMEDVSLGSVYVIKIPLIASNLSPEVYLSLLSGFLLLLLKQDLEPDPFKNDTTNSSYL